MESGIKLPFTKKPCFVVSHIHLSGGLYGIVEDYGATKGQLYFLF